MKRNIYRAVVVALALLAITALAAPQIKQAIKIIGVGAAVKQFGPDINKQFNKLTGHKDSNVRFTKVVPIITVGVKNARGAIGAAQVVGTKTQVQKVQAVASPEVSMFGEINLRAMIPVDSINIADAKSIKAVDGVGVSGIVDLKL
jgi:uncharacterized membrane protein YidH (DUF202 family)